MTTLSRSGPRSSGDGVATSASSSTRQTGSGQTGPVLDKPLIAFFALAYGLAWGIWLLEISLARTTGMTTTDFITAVEDGDFSLVSGSGLPSWLLYLMTRVQDFSFTIAGLVMITATAGARGLMTLKNRLVKFDAGARSYLLALAPIVLYGIAALIASAEEGGVATLSVGTVQTILLSLHAGFLVTLFLRGAMGEEIGLRGFALPRLQQRTTPFRASLVLGILWAGWHVPALAASDPISAIVVVLLIIGLSFIFTWMFNLGGGSLIPPLLFHAAQNWEEAFETIFPSITESDWETTAALGLLLLSIVAAIRVARQAPAHMTGEIGITPTRPSMTTGHEQKD